MEIEVNFTKRADGLLTLSDLDLSWFTLNVADLNRMTRPMIDYNTYDIPPIYGCVFVYGEGIAAVVKGLISDLEKFISAPEFSGIISK